MAFLRATKGLDPGCVCTLRVGSNTFGRNAKRCDVVLKHYAVSREHAVIQVTPEGSFIEDLGSRNGVFVNGIPLKPGTGGRRRLAPRDRIHLAAFEFVYHDDPTTDVMSIVEDTTTDSGILSTVDISADSSQAVLKKLLSSTTMAATGDMDTRRTMELTQAMPIDNAWTRLDAVLTIIEQTGGTIDDTEAPSVILDSLFRSFPQTEVGCVLLRDRQGKGFVPASVKNANSSHHAPRLSKAILKFVVENKRAVLSGDAQTDAAFSLSESAVNLRVRSIMCVPLVDLSGEVLGVIELETSKTKAQYKEADLAVLAGVARHLAIVIENAQLHAEMLKAQRAEYEERFRKLIEGSIQGVLIHRDFEPLFVNEAWATLHGYTVDEVLEMRSVLPLIAAEDREQQSSLNQRRKFDSTTPSRGEMRVVKKDGSEIWLEEFATVVDWEDGPAIQSTVIDVTEHKHVEAALRRGRDELEVRVVERTAELASANKQLQSEVAERQRAEVQLQESFSLYHSLVDHIPLCVVRKSVDGKFIFVNQALCTRMGLKPEDMVGKTDHEFFSKEQADEYRLADEQVMRTGKQLELFEIVPLPSGEVLQIHTLKTPIYDVENRLLGTQLIFWDITAQKRMEDERNRYAHELERSNLDLEQFAYNVSHDLQSPLRTIASYCQLLQKRCHDQLDEVAREYLHSALSGTKRMKQFLDDLLEYSRVSTKPRELADVDMEKVLQAVLDNLASAIRENHAIVSHDALPKVIGDKTQFVQLLQNLISNALKYRRAIAPRIHIGVEDKVDHWQFSVSDNGEGIDPKQFNRVFQIFQRLHAEHEQPGAGIGLSICKRIVERHGGRIWIESAPGEGTTFRWTIPKPHAA
jgi:PAS domain S-box-containing protein